MIPVELTGAQRDEHDALVEPIAQLVRAGKRRPLTQPEFLRLVTPLTTQRIIANGIAQLRFAEIWPGIEGVRLTNLCSRGTADTSGRRLPDS